MTCGIRKLKNFHYKNSENSAKMDLLTENFKKFHFYGLKNQKILKNVFFDMNLQSDKYQIVFALLHKK